MYWPEHVEAATIREEWDSARERLSPVAGWPPDTSSWPGRVSQVAAALSVVSSSPPLWEAQAQIVDYCSRGEGSPAPQWQTLATLDPTGEQWSSQGGLASFLADAQPEVPAQELVSAARLMADTFEPGVLDGLGSLIAKWPDVQECLILCEQSANPNCFGECIATQMG